MRAKVLSIDSPDIDDNNIYLFVGHENDPFLLQFLVGCDDHQNINYRSEEYFYVLVYTPEQLQAKLDSQVHSRIGPFLMMSSVNILKAKKLMRDSVEAIEASTWPELLNKISKLAHWEFEETV